MKFIRCLILLDQFGVVFLFALFRLLTIALLSKQYAVILMSQDLLDGKEKIISTMVGCF